MKKIILLLFVFLFSFSFVSAEVDEDSLRDLAVSSITVSPVTPALNQDAIITVEAKNNGSSNMMVDFGTKDVMYSFENFNVSSVIYPEISPDSPVMSGESFSYVFEGKFTSTGVKSLSFEIDKEDRVDETSEDNNLLEAEVEVISDENVDIEISSVNISIVRPLKEEEVQIDIVIKNIGDVALVSQDGLHELSDFTGGKDIWHSLENFVITSSSINDYPTVAEPMDPDEEFTYTFNGYFSVAGEQSVLFDVNKYKVLTEIDYENNSTSTEIIVYKDEVERDSFEISGVNIELTSSTTAIISWETGVETGGELLLKEGAMTQTPESFSDSSASIHEVSLEELTPGEIYYYKILSTNNAQERETEYMSFRTLAVDPVVIDDVEEASDTVDAEVVIDSTEDSAQPVSSESNTIDLGPIKINNSNMHSSLRGKIILRVEENGEAYYVSPTSEEMYSLGRPDDAFGVMRDQGIGISQVNLEKIPVGLGELSGVDSDGDGLSDLLEDALGTDKNNPDSDGDGHSDKSEVEGGFDPVKGGGARESLDSSFAEAQKGKIFLQVEGAGEAWYINPADSKRYFLGRPGDAFNVMRNLGLGISNNNFSSL